MSDQTLISFLRDTRSVDKFHTHVLLGPPFGTYSVGDKLSTFWKLYLREFDKGGPLYIAENPGKEIPILIDVDLSAREDVLKTKLKVDEHLYTESQLITTVKTYQEVLQKIVADIEPEALTCVLLEKPWSSQTINGVRYVKNGFHLHFPKLYLDKKVQEVYLIPLVKESLVNLFDNLNVKEFIDSNSINVHWLMYGSKKPDNVPYLATRCFLADGVACGFEEALGDYVVPSFKRDGRCKTAAGRVAKLLPVILSIFLYGKDRYYYRPKATINTPIMDYYAARKENRRVYHQVNISNNLSEANKYMALLSKRRADDRSDWLAVGFCLWNLCEGDDEGLSMWLDFSDRSEKYDEAECLSMWQNMRQNHYTIGTLKYFAKQDDPDEYGKLSVDISKTLLKKAINGSHNDIAKIMFNEYGNEFVTVDSNWYQFKRHIWKSIIKGYDLRERISCERAIIMTQFDVRLRELKEGKNENVDDKAATKSYDAKIKAIKALKKQCKSAPFKNNVMTECLEVFRNSDFSELLNKDKYLIAFGNGVYDFANDIFRDGKPEDYISVALPIDYVDYGTVDHPKVIEIVDFFRKVFPDDDVRNYFLDHACQVFVGGNKEKVFLFWTGTGNNGKTITQTLFEKMLGKLAVKFNTTLVTGKKSQMGKAAPELARTADGVRWAAMDEPNRDELISSGILKALTGNDSFWARDLFEKGKETREIIPMFKIHMICNNLPGIKDGDDATWDRIRVIPFESKFLAEESCPISYEERLASKRFPKDGNFTDRMPEMLQPLAWFLIQRWRRLTNSTRTVPDKVNAATKKYKQENDLYNQFEENVVVVDAAAKLSVIVFYKRFQQWFGDENPGQPIPNKKTIVDRFSSVWGDPVGGKHWIGYALKADDVE